MKVRDGSQNNRRSAPIVFKKGDTSCFELRTVPMITVSGAQSGVGKTKMAAALLNLLKGWSGLKVTVTHRQGQCPVHKECHTCDEVVTGFSIISDRKIIETRGKDTARLVSAGAEKVLWLKSKPEALKNGLNKAMALFKKSKGLIVESNSALKYLKPDLAILVRNKDSVLKPSVKEIVNKIDLIITL